MSNWTPNQANRICFVMVDATGAEVAGLGNGYTLELSKNGGAFAASSGTKAEIGNGWYTYLSTAGEADTPGPVAIRVTGAGASQQNLEYVVSDRSSGAVAHTYAVTAQGTGAPIDGALVRVTTDAAGLNVVASDYTDAFGNAAFMLQHGTYYFWTTKAGYTFSNPDQEVV